MDINAVFFDAKTNATGTATHAEAEGQNQMNQSNK